MMLTESDRAKRAFNSAVANKELFRSSDHGGLNNGNYIDDGTCCFDADRIVAEFGCAQMLQPERKIKRTAGMFTYISDGAAGARRRTCISAPPGDFAPGLRSIAAMPLPDFRRSAGSRSWTSVLFGVHGRRPAGSFRKTIKALLIPV